MIYILCRQLFPGSRETCLGNWPPAQARTCCCALWPLSGLRHSVAKTPASLSISPCVHPCSSAAFPQVRTLILSRGSGPCCPKEGAYCACLAGTNQERPLCHTGFYVCCERVGVGGSERKTVSCWEASQCPLEQEIEKKISNMDEGDVDVHTCAHVHAHTYRHLCLSSSLIISKYLVGCPMCLPASVAHCHAASCWSGMCSAGSKEKISWILSPVKKVKPGWFHLWWSAKDAVLFVKYLYRKFLGQN